jgi:Na+-driven multidrug efflux pump
VPGYWISNSINIALNSTKRPVPGLVMSVVSSAAQLLLCVVFSHPRLGSMGYLGIALARALGGWISLATIIAVVRQQRLQALVWRLHPESEPILKAGAMCDYLRVSVPSALVIWSEWWAFEVLSLLVGLTPHAQLNLAAHGTMFNIVVVFYMCWTGTCTAVCALVGNLLGAERHAEIRPLLRAAFAFSAATSLALAVGYELSKGWLALAFTTDVRVQTIMTRSSLGLVLSVPLYAQMMTFYGALRGANYQRPGILGTFVGYWFVGLPLGGYLGCVLHWPTPLVGVWLGNVVALAISASWVMVAVFCRIDWESVRPASAIRASLLPGVARDSARELAKTGATSGNAGQ